MLNYQRAHGYIHGGSTAKHRVFHGDIFLCDYCCSSTTIAVCFGFFKNHLTLPTSQKNRPHGMGSHGMSWLNQPWLPGTEAVEVDEICFNSAISACCSCMQWPKAMALTLQMEVPWAEWNSQLWRCDIQDWIEFNCWYGWYMMILIYDMLINFFIVHFFHLFHPSREDDHAWLVFWSLLRCLGWMTSTGTDIKRYQVSRGISRIPGRWEGIKHVSNRKNLGNTKYVFDGHWFMEIDGNC